jgi:hypothetical protein
MGLEGPNSKRVSVLSVSQPEHTMTILLEGHYLLRKNNIFSSSKQKEIHYVRKNIMQVKWYTFNAHCRIVKHKGP